jgi:hypothetical protein
MAGLCQAPAWIEQHMTTPLEKTLKRALTINGRPYVLAVSPDGLKLTLKGRRNGFELQWSALVSGEAALATALNASVGQFVPVPKAIERKARDAKGPRTSGRARRASARNRAAK